MEEKETGDSLQSDSVQLDSMQADPIQPDSVPLETRSTKRKKMDRKTRNIIIYSALALVLVLGLGTAYAMHVFYSFAGNIYVDPNENPANIDPDAPKEGDPDYQPVSAAPEWDGHERINIVLFGADSRGLENTRLSRSDTMMIVSINPEDKSVRLFSILRDTYVKIANHGSNRLNAAIVFGGPRLAMSTISSFVDLPLHYYVYTDFEGFISLIDSIGGIDYEVDKKMVHIDNRDDPRYNIRLEPGLQHMDGVTALQYVRFRSDALSDYSRSDRQRQFIGAIATELKKTTNLFKLPSLLNSIAPYIQTDIPPDELFDLARLALKLDMSTMSGVMLPQQGAFTNEIISDMDVIVPNIEKVQAYVKEQLGE
ncbi:MAG: LCP family protein [Candidatus Cohnella colombiensis]|uniref:LCP family protein n=1 Tax=Candidatus Cohnella colombiensis TaxID=3121368 RepID=A0AA95EX60_9BACL|nr:MAG: LCP family protein [Cohnella sp.]